MWQELSDFVSSGGMVIKEEKGFLIITIIWNFYHEYMFLLE